MNDEMQPVPPKPTPQEPVAPANDQPEVQSLTVNQALIDFVRHTRIAMLWLEKHFDGQGMPNAVGQMFANASSGAGRVLMVLNVDSSEDVNRVP